MLPLKRGFQVLGRPDLLLVPALVLGSACTSKIAQPGSEGTPGGGVSGTKPTDPSAPLTPEQQAAADDANAVEIAETDSELAATDPELFEIARRYFPGDDPSSPRDRLFRLTRLQLDQTTDTILPGVRASSTVDALPADPLQRNYEYSDFLEFNSTNFTPYTQWVAQIADVVRSDPSLVVGCAEMDAACLEAEARQFVRVAFRNVPSEEQMERFIEFYTTSVAAVGLAAATADLVDVVLTSPHYVFREEVLTDSTLTLLPAQQLQNVTYSLADLPPDALGFASASAASLVDSPERLAETVRQVLATPAARDKLMRFFIAWLEVKDVDSFDIAPSAFPEFTPEVAQAALDETQTFLETQLSSAAPSLKDVTQSTSSFVSDALSFIYDGALSEGNSPVELDPSQRLGLFTQPAFIASHSGPETTRLVKRGVFFTRKVMCLPLGEPPAQVDTTIPEIDGATERQRVETVTDAPSCQGCHSVINPFGFMLENYDAIGRWREEDENGLPIDSSIEVDFLDEGPLASTSPVDALSGFTNSLAFQQCFTRQLFRFYMGRPEVASDDPILRQLFFNFAHGGVQDIVAMLGTLAGSTTFSRRSEAP